jgi:uncharacterized protein (TIGR01244 family)
MREEGEVMRRWNRPAFFSACVMCLVLLAPASSEAGPRSTQDGLDARLVERGPASLAEADLARTFRNPAEDLYTGGQPTAEQLQQAATAGITTVIDLRQPTEDRGFDETATAASLGLHYVRIPVGGAAGLTPAKVQALQAALAQANGPVLLHCASGNRVGALLALMKAQQGASTEQALQFGREAGMTSLEAQTRTLLEQDTAR